MDEFVVSLSCADMFPIYIYRFVISYEKKSCFHHHHHHHLQSPSTKATDTESNQTRRPIEILQRNIPKINKKNEYIEWENIFFFFLSQSGLLFFSQSLSTSARTVVYIQIRELLNKKKEVFTKFGFICAFWSFDRLINSGEFRKMRKAPKRDGIRLFVHGDIDMATMTMTTATAYISTSSHSHSETGPVVHYYRIKLYGCERMNIDAIHKSS